MTSDMSFIDVFNIPHSLPKKIYEMPKQIRLDFVMEILRVKLVYKPRNFVFNFFSGLGKQFNFTKIRNFSFWTSVNHKAQYQSMDECYFRWEGHTFQLYHHHGDVRGQFNKHVLTLKFTHSGKWPILKAVKILWVWYWKAYNGI